MFTRLASRLKGDRLKLIQMHRADTDPNPRRRPAHPRARPQGLTGLTPRYLKTLTKRPSQRRETKSTTPQLRANTSLRVAEPTLSSCSLRQLPIHELQSAMNSIMECTRRVAAVKHTDNGNLVVSVTPANLLPVSLRLNSGSRSSNTSPRHARNRIRVLLPPQTRSLGLRNPSRYALPYKP